MRTLLLLDMNAQEHHETYTTRGNTAYDQNSKVFFFRWPPEIRYIVYMFAFKKGTLMLYSALSNWCFKSKLVRKRGSASGYIGVLGWMLSCWRA